MTMYAHFDFIDFFFILHDYRDRTLMYFCFVPPSESPTPQKLSPPQETPTCSSSSSTSSSPPLPPPPFCGHVVVVLYGDDAKTHESHKLSSPIVNTESTKLRFLRFLVKPALNPRRVRGKNVWKKLKTFKKKRRKNEKLICREQNSSLCHT